MDPLFPVLPGPQELEALSVEEIQALLEEHEVAAEKINADDEEFLGELAQPGREAEIIAEYEKGVEQIKQLRAELKTRADAYQAYQDKKAELAAQLEEKEEEPEEAEVVAESEGDDTGDDAGDGDEGSAEEEPAEVQAEEKELEPVLAAGTANTVTARVRFSRTPPAPSPERTPAPTEPASTGTALVAAAEWRQDYPDPFEPLTLAQAVIDAASTYGPMPHRDPPGSYVSEGPIGNVYWDGPRHKIARAEYPFPSDRDLDGDVDRNTEKIRSVLPEYVNFLGKPGGHGGQALVASGGLCAPLEPFYSMPNFATEAEPVWDSLPAFRARRGGVNTPEATIIGDITTAISSISESDDALGGTFATKSCQDLTCPEYTEVAVQILAHCREYGNLNARAWPEKIAHENALTMAALAQTSENFILERIKALSINVTSGANTLSALTYLVDAIAKSMFGIRGRLRMPREARFVALLPAVMLDMLLVDAVQNAFDRYKTRGDLDAYLRSTGVDPVYYLDGNFTAGDDMVPDAAQAAGALESWPNTFQWALYPQGTFLGIDSGTLELGIVRDSTLNSTNDFQVFGERFRNVARIGPAQAAYWETTTLCAVGTFPPAGTARGCES